VHCPGGPVLSYIDQAAGIAAASGDAPLGGTPSGSISEHLLERILTTLSDSKAEDVFVIDLRGRSELADHMVIASGRSSRQVSALAGKLTDEIKETFGLSARVEGKDQGDWVLIDAGDVIVHVFRPEVRDFYQIEKMWSEPASPRT
jgi:ribosome-associated protein